MYSLAVAIPAYARPDYLRQLVASIPPSISVYISDNAHSLRGIDLGFGPNVSISHTETLIPVFSNWNRALSLVGDGVTHVLIPGDDDLYVPRAFDHILKAIADHDDADVFIFGSDLVDETGYVRQGYKPPRLEVLSPGQGFLKFWHGVEARMPGIVFRKAFFDHIGTFDERFKLTADSELIQRALLLGKSIFIPEVVSLYRIWRGGLTQSRQGTAQWMDEIEMWTDEIVKLLKGVRRPTDLVVDIGTYKDEIFARNLLAGARALKARREYRLAQEFLRQSRSPRAATLRTKIRLVRCRLGLLGYSLV